MTSYRSPRRLLPISATVFVGMFSTAISQLSKAVDTASCQNRRLACRECAIDAATQLEAYQVLGCLGCFK
jgi:hypothetical protein